MAFVPGLSKKQVEKVILNYAEIAPETMQLLDDLSTQINDPNDPAAALIDRMVVVESDVNSLESSVSSLNSAVSGKQDAVAGISSAEIGTLDGIQSSIQGQLDSKAPLSSPTISNPTFTGTVTLPNASIANNKLQNSSISINGTSVPLGGNATVVGTALPNQSGNTGKALVTDGSSLSWGLIDVSNLTNPRLNVDNYEPSRGIVNMVSGTENFLTLTLNSSTRQGVFTFIQPNYNDPYYLSLSVLGSVLSNEIYYNPDRQYELKVPKAWLNGQLGFPPEGGWAEEDYVFINYTGFTDGWNESNTVYTYVINFTVPEGIDIITQETTSLYGEFGFYRYYGDVKVSEELKYLDGVTSNIQSQINTIKNSGELVDPVIKISNNELQMGTSRTFDGVMSFNLIPNRDPESGGAGQAVILIDDVAYGSESYEWQRDTALLTSTDGLNQDWSSGEYYTRITGTSIGDFDFETTFWGGMMGSDVLQFAVKWSGPWIFEDSLSGTISLIKKPKKTISPTELSYLDGVTSNIQEQINLANESSSLEEVILNKDFRDYAVLELAKGNIYYSNVQPETSWSTFISLYNNTDLETDNPAYFLNGAMTIGQATTFVVIQKNTSTGLYFDEVRAEIFGDSSTVNLMWQGGSAPTAPNLNATDIYTFTVLKTANNVFDVFADVAKFA